MARASNEVAAEAEAGRRLDPGAFAELVKLEAGGALTATQSKTVLGELLAAGGGDPAAIAATHGFEAMDTGALDATIDEIIAAHSDEWQRYVEVRVLLEEDVERGEPAQDVLRQVGAIHAQDWELAPALQAGFFSNPRTPGRRATARVAS